MALLNPPTMTFPPPSAAPSQDSFELTDLWAPESASTQNEGPKIRDGLSAPITRADHNRPMPPQSVRRPRDLPDLGNETHASDHLFLDHLHQAYWQYLHQAHAQPDAQDWNNVPAAAASDKGPLEDLTRHASHYESLYSILGDKVAIDDVMAGLDPLGTQDLLQPDPPQSILHLFAPPMSTPDEAALPTLTLREHHVVTADSAFSPPVSSPRLPEASPMPPHHPIGPQDLT